MSGVDTPQSVNGDALPALLEGTTQNVTTSGTSAQSSAFGANTRIVRVVCTANAWITFGENPTATTSKIYMPANAIDYFHVCGSWKLAAIQDSEAGTVNITEGA